MRLTKAERDLVKLFLRFLNLPPITDAGAVAALFGGSGLVLAAGGWAGVSAAAYASDQAEWRRRLTPLAAAFGKPHRTVQAAARALVPVIRDDLRDKTFLADLGLDADGRRQDQLYPPGVLAACAYAGRLLIDPELGLRGRLGQCGAEVHGDWPPFVLTFTHKPRRHCTPKHTAAVRRQGGAARQKRYRKRQKQRARAERAAQKGRE
jgi:hypothetical protein